MFKVSAMIRSTQSRCEKEVAPELFKPVGAPPASVILRSPGCCARQGERNRSSAQVIRSSLWIPWLIQSVYG
jgi:hypothetical protein